MGRVFSYARVSTDKQDNSLDVQETKLRAASTERGWEFGKEVPCPGGTISSFFTDESCTSKIPLAERAGGGAMVRLLQKGDTVLVTKIDRAFRSIAELAYWVDEFTERGVTLVLVDQHLDTSDKYGRTFIYFLGVFAQFEREILAERTAEALAERRRQGKRTTQDPRVGYKFVKTGAYKKDGRPEFIEVPDQRIQWLAGQARKMVSGELDGQCYSKEVIAKHLNDLHDQGMDTKRCRLVMKKKKTGPNKGQPCRDDKGHVIYEEVPIDWSETAIERLLNLAAQLQAPVPSASEDRRA